MFRKRFWCHRAALCTALAAAMTYGVSTSAVFGGIGDTIEIDGNMKDGSAGGPVDWCCLVDCLAGNCACLGNVEVEIFDGVFGDCQLGNTCGALGASPPGTCAGTVDPCSTGEDRFFTGGGSKDQDAIDCDGFLLDAGDDITTSANKCWQHVIERGGPNDKTNIQNGLITLLVDPTNGNKILAFAGDLFADNGTAQIGVWLLKNQVGPECDTSGAQPWEGNHAVGDVQVLVDFTQGGRVGTITFRTVTEVKSDGKVVLSSDTTAVGQAAAFNQEIIEPADTCWCYQSKFPQAGFGFRRYPATTFFSAAIDLTANNLEGCFTSFVLQTRTSQSITATYKDFINGEFDTCRDISGKKFEAETVVGAIPPSPDCVAGDPLEGWEIRLLDAAGNLVTTDGNNNPLDNPFCTDATGFYEFRDLPGGETFQVCEVLPRRQDGENFTWNNCFPDGASVGDDIAAPGDCPASAPGGVERCYDPFELTDDAEDRDFINFKNIPTAIVSGIKFCDEDGDGVDDPNPADPGEAGFCICLTKADGSVTCQLTGADGSYEFPDIEAGQTVTVREDIDGSDCGGPDNSVVWVPTTVSFADVVIPPDAAQDQVVEGPDFGNTSRPTISCNAGPVVNLKNDAGLCSAEFCFTPTAENLCGDVTIECEASGGVLLTEDAGEWCGDFPAGCPEVTTVTCTATTEAGLTDECSFDVSVTDNEDPDATCGDDGVFECPHTIVFDPCEFDDNCPGFTPASSIVNLTAVCPDVEVQRQTCSVEDICGNFDECTQTIRVQDTTPPTIECADDETHECPADPPFTPPDCDDLCQDCDIRITSDVSDPDRCLATKTRCWEAFDPCENVSDECCQTITVEDTTPPTITDPVSKKIDCTETPVFDPPTCEDDCGDCDIRMTFNGGPGGNCGGTLTRCWVADDPCGNTSREVCQTITINDDTAPTITDPADKTIDCADPVTFDPPSCDDDCGGCTVNMTSDGGPGGICGGTLTRCWNAVDDCGNVSPEVCQTITVEDTTAPTITDPADKTIDCADPVTFDPPSCDDDCGGCTVNMTSDGGPGGICGGTLTRCWNAVDDCGNVSREVCQTITINDTTDPTVQCPDDQVLDCNAPFEFTPVADDDCDPNPVVECRVKSASDPSRVVFEDLGGGDFRVTLIATATATIECTATDACGNESDPCEFDVSAVCDQACSPGFWRNHDDCWCGLGDANEFQPRDNFCPVPPATAGATTFLDAFGIADCNGAPGNVRSFYNSATLLEAVSTSGGNFQTGFHCSAALLSSHAVSFPAGPAAVRDLVSRACNGTISWTAAQNQCTTWNAAEEEGGCPISGGCP